VSKTTTQTCPEEVHLPLFSGIRADHLVFFPKTAFYLTFPAFSQPRQRRVDIKKKKKNAICFRTGTGIS